MKLPFPDDPNELELCCGKGRCPTIKQKTSGFSLVDDDGKAIDLSPEQAQKLAAWLMMRLHGESNAAE